MCNIAGYLGNRQAAPILLEMLRKQAAYDGDMSTGIATIHEGKLHYRKMVGNVETLIRETDALDLPGTMGIAHTRPGAGSDGVAYHPALSMDETMALVTNGTTDAKSKYCADWDRAVELLVQNGCKFRMETQNPQGKSPKLASNGNYIWPMEARVFLIEHYIKQGKTPTEALALSCAHMYSDNVTVTINQNYPDRIFALRTSRPMVAAMKEGETYMATTRFGLPEGLGEVAFDLPLFYACAVTRDGVVVSKDRMEAEPVSEMTAFTYHEGYRKMEALLKSERAPLYFDELEFAVNDMQNLWEGHHTHIQNARLVYDLLWQFEQEGRLRRDLRIQQRDNGTRRRYYMWLEDEGKDRSKA